MAFSQLVYPNQMAMMANVKKLLFEQLARVGKVFANANRMEILEFLAQGEKSVEELARIMGITVPNTSQHLQQLLHAGLVTARKERHRVFYTLYDDTVVELLGIIRKIAEKNNSELESLINTYLKSKDSLEPVSASDLLERLRENSVVVIDVRPPDEYEAGHVPNAINIPIKELQHKLAGLKMDKEIIAYCRGPYCMMSFEAVEQLRAYGFKARRLEDGLPEWKHAGMPVEKEKN